MRYVVYALASLFIGFLDYAVYESVSSDYKFIVAWIGGCIVSWISSWAFDKE